jgi:hypothetical protein
MHANVRHLQKQHECSAALVSDASPGSTSCDIQSAMYFRPGVFRNCIERIALPPPELYWRASPGFVTFGSKIEARQLKESFQPGSMDQNQQSFERDLAWIRLVDPQGFNFYRLRLGTDFKPAVDKYDTVSSCYDTLQPRNE